MEDDGGTKTVMNLPENYKARKGAVNKGKDFEIDVLVLSVLKNGFDKQVEDFRISSNVEGLESFDDLVESRKINGKWSTCLTQLKTKLNSKNKLCAGTLLSKKNFLSLPNQCESYQKIVGKPCPDILLGGFANTKWYLYTNASLSEDLETISESHLHLDTSGKENAVFTVKPGTMIYNKMKEYEKGEEFFSKVTLFTSQKCGEALKHHTIALIQETYSREDIDSTALFGGIRTFCEKYLEKKKFITKQKFKKELGSLVINQIHRKSMDKGRDLGVGFSAESMKEMQELIQKGRHRQLWFSKDNSPELCVWKTKKVVEKMKDVVYISAPYLKKYEEEMKFFQKANLIIETEQPEVTTSAVEGITERLIVLSRRKRQRKIEGWEEKEMETSWEDLNQESKDSLIQNYVSFQGGHLPLRSMLEGLSKDRISHLRGRLLLDLISGDSLKFGEEFKENDFEYVERTLESTRIIVDGLENIYDNERKNECYVIINGEIFENEIQKIHPQCDSKSIENTRIYGNLCFTSKHYYNNQTKKELEKLFKNLHILTTEENEKKLIWTKSYKDKISICNLRKQNISVKQDELDNLKDQFLIINNEPGSGKTSLSTHLAKQLKVKHPEKFLFFTHLSSCQGYLEKNKITDMPSVEKFLSENNVSKGNAFYNFLIRDFLETTDKAILILDGFDELSSEIFRENVFRLINILLSSGKVRKIVLTTRKNMRLDERFPTYAIRELDKDDQAKLLIENCKRLLGSEEDLEKIELFCDELMNLYKVEKRDLISLGIPLHIKILVESFEVELRSYVKGEELVLPSSLNILELYEKYNRSKNDILIKDKLGGNSQYDEDRNSETIKANEAKCMKAALILLFKNHLSRISPPVSEEEEKNILSEIKEGKIKCGIISHVENDQPIFIHLTMAEFFVGKFFYSNLESNIKFIEETSELKTRYPVISLFLNLLLARKSKFLTSIIINDKQETVKQFLGGVDDIDEGERNFLHLSILYKRYEIILALCEERKEFVIEKMGIIRAKTKISYFIEVKDFLHLVELLLGQGADPGLLKWEDLDQFNFINYLKESINCDYLNVFQTLSNVSKEKEQDILPLLSRIDALEIASTNDCPNILNALITNYKWKYKELKRVYIETIRWEKEHCLKMLLTEERGFEDEKFYNEILITAVIAGKISICKNIIKLILKGKYKSNIDSICTQALSRGYLDLRNEDLCIYLIEQGAELDNFIISQFVKTKKLKVTEFIAKQYMTSNHKMVFPLLPLAIERKLMSFDKIPPELIYTKDNEKKRTIVHWCCLGLNTEKVVEGILNIHKDNMRRGLSQDDEYINWKDKKGFTPLHIAMSDASIDVVRVLIKNGADINILNRFKKSPLSYISENINEYNEKLKLILKHGTLLKEKNNIFHETPLHSASEKGNALSVKLLLEMGFNVNALNEKGESPLMYLCMKKEAFERSEKLKMLAKCGIAINNCDRNGNTALHYLLKTKDCESTRILLENRANVNALNAKRETPLIYLCKEKDALDRSKKIKMLLEYGGRINNSDKNGNTALHHVLKTEDCESTNILLENKADVNALNERGETPLIFLWTGSFDQLFTLIYKNIPNCNEIMKTLIAYGASIDKSDNLGNTALHWASEYGNSESVTVLLENKADINLFNKQGETPLLYLCRKPYREYGVSKNKKLSSFKNKIKRLVECGSSINHYDKDHQTALHWLLKYGDSELLKFSLDKNANINVLNKDGETPFIFLCKEKPDDIDKYNENIKFIVELGASINESDIDGNTALHWSSRNGDCDSIRILLDKKADINALNKKDETPLIFLCKEKLYSFEKYKEKIKFLIKLGASINICDIDDNTALHWSSRNGDCDSIRILIDNNADINVLNKKGETLLMFLCKAKPDYIVRYNEKIKFLVELGAVINGSDTDGNTGLHWSSRNGDCDSIRILLDKKVDINVLNEKRETPLIFLCKEKLYFFDKYNEKIKFLVELGASVNRSDKYGNTALHWASRTGYYDSIKVLCEMGSDINVLNKEGETPLIFFCKEKPVNIYKYNKNMKFLIESGASVNISGKYGLTALQWASKYGDQKSKSILLKNKATVDKKQIVFPYRKKLFIFCVILGPLFITYYLILSNYIYK